MILLPEGYITMGLLFWGPCVEVAAVDFSVDLVDIDSISEK